jgi:hypothetical protein
MWVEHGGSHGESEVLWKLFGCGRMYGCVEKLEGRLRSEGVSMKAPSSVSFSTVTEVYEFNCPKVDQTRNLGRVIRGY